MTQAGGVTRQALLDHATDVFAETGYELASVREITSRAGANLAAINYHFGGKEALYREVLSLALAALSEASLVDDEALDRAPREEAVRLFIRRQVAPLLRFAELSRYLRIFAREALSPTQIYSLFIAEEKLPMLAQAERIVRRFRSAEASRAEILIAAIWLSQQAAPFIRHCESLSKQPLRFEIDAPFVDRLAADLGAMALAGLMALENDRGRAPGAALG